MSIYGPNFYEINEQDFLDREEVMGGDLLDEQERDFDEDDDERAAWADSLDEGDGYGGREDAYLDTYMESRLMGEC